MSTDCQDSDRIIQDIIVRFQLIPETRELLTLAFQHRSWTHEHLPQATEKPEANERLEFLGDAILGLIMARMLYERMPQADEGLLSKAKAQLVSAPVLAEFAKMMDLGKALRIGRGEENSGGRSRVSLLANVMEAVIGAIYLSEGISAAERLVSALWQDELDKLADGLTIIDYKTQLQEMVQKVNGMLPVYQVEKSSGPDHQRKFEVSVSIDGVISGRGCGLSKKQAAQQAAEEAYKKLANLKTKIGEGK